MNKHNAPVSLGDLAEKVGLTGRSVSMSDVAARIGYTKTPISLGELAEAVDKHVANKTRMKIDSGKISDRAVDLFHAYQHGQDAAKGDTTAQSDFNQKFPNDAEAKAEFDRGFREQQGRNNGVMPPLD